MHWTSYIRLLNISVSSCSNASYMNEVGYEDYFAHKLLRMDKYFYLIDRMVSYGSRILHIHITLQMLKI